MKLIESQKILQNLIFLKKMKDIEQIIYYLPNPRAATSVATRIESLFLLNSKI